MDILMIDARFGMSQSNNFSALSSEVHGFLSRRYAGTVLHSVWMGYALS